MNDDDGIEAAIDNMKVEKSQTKEVIIEAPKDWGKSIIRQL